MRRSEAAMDHARLGTADGVSVPRSARGSLSLVLAVASYGGDPEVLRVMAEVHRPKFAGMFTAMAVVDSGPPSTCSRLRIYLERQYPNVEYHHYTRNLGSAGNLVERIRWAQATGGQFLLAVNADGHVDADNVHRMLSFVAARPPAAIFPTYVMPGALIDGSGRRPIPVLPSRRSVKQVRGRRVQPVSWGSSNGAIYRLDAMTSVDLDRLASLWYGWEDLALGLALREANERQFRCLNAQQPSPNDLRPLAWGSAMVSDKPPWTTYYTVRNLTLIARWYPRYVPLVALRVVREFIMIAIRPDRRERLRTGVLGLRDGLRGRTGHRVSPTTGSRRGR
jgi:hypothetical protein